MVLPLIVIGVLVLAFLPQIATAVKGFTSGNNSDVKEQRELEKQIQREDEGIFGTIGRIFLGDKSFDEKKIVQDETNNNKLTISVKTNSPVVTSAQSGITINKGALSQDNKVIGFTGLTGFSDFTQSRKKGALE